MANIGPPALLRRDLLCDRQSTLSQFTCCDIGSKVRASDRHEWVISPLHLNDTDTPSYLSRNRSCHSLSGKRRSYLSIRTLEVQARPGIALILVLRMQLSNGIVRWANLGTRALTNKPFVLLRMKCPYGNSLHGTIYSHSVKIEARYPARSILRL